MDLSCGPSGSSNLLLLLLSILRQSLRTTTFGLFGWLPPESPGGPTCPCHLGTAGVLPLCAHVNLSLTGTSGQSHQHAARSQSSEASGAW